MAEEPSKRALTESGAAESAEIAAMIAQGKALGLDDGSAKEYYKGQAAFWNLAAKSEMESSTQDSFKAELLRTVAELVRSDE